MKKNVAIIALAAFAALTSVNSAEARLLEAFSNLPKELIRKAVHIPTGCIAQVTVIDRKVVHADIVDPECLPAGIKARPIPGKDRDFSIIETSR